MVIRRISLGSHSKNHNQIKKKDIKDKVAERERPFQTILRFIEKRIDINRLSIPIIPLDILSVTRFHLP